MKILPPVVSPRWRAQILLLTVILLGGCAAPAATMTPVVTISAATTPRSVPEFAEAAEAWRLLSSQGDQVWPGWGAARIPLLVRAGEFDLLAGHPSPPKGFHLLPDATVADQPIYRFAGHLVPAPAATAWKVGNVWSVAVPAREEFQQTIDAQLGKGAVQLDADSYVRAIVHEAFHAYVMTNTHGDVPNFGADVDEGDMLQRLSALPNLDQQQVAEGQALARALQAADDQAARQAAAEFLGLRQARRAAEDQRIAAYEQTTEWLEGLARYAEVELMRRAGNEDDPQSTASIHFPTAAEIWQPFLEQLARPTASPDGFRGRYYLLGAGQAFLLDRWMPGWKIRALDGKLSLEELLREALR